MPYGKIGDHPLSDIVALGGRDEIGDVPFLDYNPFARPDVAKLEEVLVEIHDRLTREDF